MKEETQEEVRMAYYLPKVVEEAVRLHHPEVFIGDMIQEGNIALMVALKEIPKEKEEYGRKVSVDEVAERLGISEDEIEDILKLAGEEVKDEE